MEQKSWSFPQKDALPRIEQLPDPFVGPDGKRVQTPEEWPQQREYLKEMLAHYMYGHIPPAPGNTQGNVVFSRPVYNGRAVAETVEITAGPGVRFTAELIRPCKEGRVPVITWNQFKNVHGCPIEEEIVCQRGYAVMEFEKEQLAPDSSDALSGQLGKAYPEYDWGAIAMWAWGHMRLVDYLLTTDWADPDKIVATGHSRGGKVALCAAIYDERIALCAASCSGCGGAGCYRFLGGRQGEGTGICETAGSIEDAFPFWWTDQFAQFGDRMGSYTRSNCAGVDPMKVFGQAAQAGHPLGTTKDEAYMPFDLHFVKALIAPRALITTDGLSDTWANPFGTQVTWRAAQEVYDFLGAPSMNAMHFRDGGHAYNVKNWTAVADFCDSVFFGKEHGDDITRFLPLKKNNKSMEAFDKRLDWKREKLHYSWRCPGSET